MEKKIEIIFEESILTPYGITVDDIAVANSYKPMINNPDYVPAVGDVEIQDPEWERPDDFDDLTGDIPTVPNPDHVPAVGEPTIANPETATEYVAKMLPAVGMQRMIYKVMEPKIAEAESAVAALKKQPVTIAAAVTEALTKTVTE